MEAPFPGVEVKPKAFQAVLYPLCQPLRGRKTLLKQHAGLNLPDDTPPCECRRDASVCVGRAAEKSTDGSGT